jgi:uncharacterized protein (TIGR03437 family)
VILSRRDRLQAPNESFKYNRAFNLLYMTDSHGRARVIHAFAHEAPAYEPASRRSSMLFPAAGRRTRLRMGFRCKDVAALLCLISPLLPNLAAQASGQTGDRGAGGAAILQGVAKPRVRPENDRGRVQSEEKLSHITLTLKRTLEQHAALDQLLDELQDPSSPNYHKWLTPEEFGERFGAQASDLTRVADWLRSEGFTVESTARGRGWIVFNGTAGQAEGAFGTEIHRYATDGRMHFGPASPPAVPAEFKQLIVSIRGLDDFHWEPPRRFTPLLTESNGSHALAPADLVNIYGLYGVLANGIDGTGQSIVIVGQSGIHLSDIQDFRTTFGLPDLLPQTILVGDDPGLDLKGGGMLEADADLEWAGAVAPNANLIYVYAPDVLDAVQAAIDRNLAPVIGMSYSSCEPSVSSGDAGALRDLAQQANAQGITWIASSGDSGAAGCDQQGTYPASQGLAVGLPASVPEVTGVGGTEFNEGSGTYWVPTNSQHFGSVGGYIPEIAWNDTSAANGLWASGGGASALYPKPAWQTGPGVPARNARYVPDISFSASPYHDPYVTQSGGSLYAVGGTSVGAPVMAGAVALLNQRLASVKAQPGLGNINPLLYSEKPTVYHDTVTGNNIVPCADGSPDCVNGSLGYTAGPGYDPVTGLGSVDIGALVLFNQIPTATTLTAPASVVVEGPAGLVTFSVTVTYPCNLAPSSTEWVVVQGPDVVGSGRLSSGVATVQVLGFSPGTWTLTASYLGGGVFAPSTSSPVTILVTPDQPAPMLVYPANQASGIPDAVELKWTGARYATSYDVYFGTEPSPPLWGKTTSFAVTPSAPAPNTTYHWKIVANTLSGPVSSPTWSFTTTNQSLYTISTFAGIGQLTAAGLVEQVGFSGDGGPATQAELLVPADVVLDRSGNLYIADSYAGRIRMVTPTGIISTVAGSGAIGGNSGDGGPALAAGLSGARGIAFDPLGNLYISSGNQIRMVAPNGIISTVAGTFSIGYSGDGGPAANARLSSPSGLATDSAGNLYIADTGNNCVREIAGGTISTVAGKCVSFVDYSNLGDGGAATSAVIGMPTGVAVDSTGNLYIADQGNRRIRKVSNGIITTIAGGGNAEALLAPPGEPALNVFFAPVRLAVDSAGNVFFTAGELGNFKSGVYKVANGLLTVLAGDVTGLGLNPGDGEGATSVMLLDPAGIAVGTGSTVYFADSRYGRIRVLNLSAGPSPPAIASGGVLNAASLAPGPVAPGSIATVFGTFGLNSSSQAAGVPLPTALTGLSVQFQSGGSINAPLFYASAGQANIQIPWELSGQTAVPIAAVLNGASGPAQVLRLAPFAPAIFATNGQGTGQGVIVDSSYRLVDSSNPATAGSAIQIYCTGLGAVANAPATGFPASGTTLTPTTVTPSVTIGGIAVVVLFSGLAPASVGEYQVNVQVPAGVAAGQAVPVAISIGGVTSNTVTIAVH